MTDADRCRFTVVEGYASFFANKTRVSQVLWYSTAVDTYGRTPLPEWNQKHARQASLRVVRVISPKP